MTKLADLKIRLMANPGFQEEYAAADAEFSLLEALVNARAEVGLTQAELANRLGTTQSAIARLESGGTSPSMATFRRYAAATGKRLEVRLVRWKKRQKYSIFEYFCRRVCAALQFGISVLRQDISGSNQMDREGALRLACDTLQYPLWSLADQLDILLRDLSQATHFDLDDPTAIGAAVHGAIPGAFAAAELAGRGLEVQSYEVGPCYKLAGVMDVDGTARDFSIELHCGGPNGGTRKKVHQFAPFDIDGAPELPGFEIEAPRTLLFFLTYYLTGTRTSIDRMFLGFADGVDRKKIRLLRAPPIAVEEDVPAPAAPAAPAAKLTIKGDAERKANGHGDATKRRDDSSS